MARDEAAVAEAAEDLAESAEAQRPGGDAVVDMPRSISSGTWLTTTAKAVNAPSATAAISSRKARLRATASGACSTGPTVSAGSGSGQRPRSPNRCAGIVIDPRTAARMR